MTGNVVSMASRPHECAPGWTTEWSEGTPDGMFSAGSYAHPPSPRDYPAGTVWQCECGQTWVSLGATGPFSRGFCDWRRERRRERRRRERASGG